MATAKPQISILMAVYEPRMDWLKEQLDSLNAQTYPNLKLYVRDDCSPTVPYEDIERLVAECITAFPYETARNERNLSSNGTFELLTREADGDFFAYCDQDDVWLPEKLTVLQEKLERTDSLLVCSDMYIIDGEGKQVADSITKIRRRHIFRSGENLTDTLWYSNFASGCALLVKSDAAKAAIPFNPYMYYDHYVALFSANRGRVTSILKPLILHREHGTNQSSVMQGVTDKDSYKRIRIDTPAAATKWLCEHFDGNEQLTETLRTGLEWLTARQEYNSGMRQKWRVLWQYRKFSPKVTLFELAIPYMPNFLFDFALSLSRNNIV